MVILLAVVRSKSSFIQLPFLKHVTLDGFFFAQNDTVSPILLFISWMYFMLQIMPPGNLHRNFL